MDLRKPPPHNKKVAACAHYVRSGGRGTEAAPATSERYRTSQQGIRGEKRNDTNPFGDIPSVIEHVRRTIDDPRVQIKPVGQLASDPSPVSTPNSPSFDVLQRTIGQVFPEVLVAPGQFVGATDSRHYAKLSSDIYRFCPMWAGPGDLDRIHGTNERISIENYEQIVRFYIQLIHNSAL